MPISRTYSFAFIHVRKTAGTSIVRVLETSDPQLYLNEKGLWDVLQVHPDRRRLLSLLREYYLVGSVDNFPQWHLPAMVVRQLIGQANWAKLFTFAFVRNPWDLVVSAYHFEKNYLAQPSVGRFERDRAEALRRCHDFEEFVRLYPLLEPRDMTSMIVDENNDLMVDYIGRFETLKSDFAHVCSTIGLPKIELPHENVRPNRKEYRGYYSNDTRTLVAKYFARDIRNFDYEF